MARSQHYLPLVMGFALWFTTGWESFYWIGIMSTSLSAFDVMWLVAFVSFALALAAQLGTPALAPLSRRTVVLLAVQSASALSMMTMPCYFGPSLVAYVAWRAGLTFPARTAFSFTAIQGVGFTAIVLAYGDVSMSTIGGNLAFQAITVSSAVFAIGEARGRIALMQTNAELSRARDQLAEQTVAAERGRIAREIHDVLGHHLAALSLQLEVASHQTEGAGREAVARAQHLARSLLGDVRLVVGAYRSGEPIDVRASLEKLLGNLERPAPHLTIRGDVQIDQPVLAHTLVRCVQELVTNVLKHADADNLWVDVERTEAGISAQVRDDGAGCGDLRPGFGLSGVRERLEQIGGELTIDCACARGMTVTARLPINAESRGALSLPGAGLDGGAA
jgi:signal transduction histidine kinase